MLLTTKPHGYRNIVFGIALLLAVSCNKGTASDPEPDKTPDTSSNSVSPTDSSTSPREKPVPAKTPPAVAQAKPKSSSSHTPKYASIALPGAKPMPSALVKQLEDGRKTAPETALHHTKNFAANGTPKYINRLVLETSPYLLQHCYNPVDWYPFGPEALARAKEENKLIFLSVGYTTCHWCHVMSRESFDDPTVAKYLNENFVSIKVDREERPDIDRVYMSVVQMLTGNGGWPMTVILTPDLKPLFGGTYFPPTDRGRRQSFMSILQEVSNTWTTDPDGARKKAGEIAQKLSSRARTGLPSNIPGQEATAHSADYFVQRHDAQFGGFGRAPKFPRPSTLFFLVRHAKRQPRKELKDSIVRTLDAMATGGMHDHAGGGFHRYAVDPHWRIPHFEKMLYDNAQLAWLYLEASVAFGMPQYAELAHRTYRYLLRDCQAPDGGFMSGTDADSLPMDGKGHPEEGLFFTWTPSELTTVLGADITPEFVKTFRVTSRGNFEGGRSILYLDGPWESDPRKSLAKAREFDAQLEQLRVSRQVRPPPETDGKRVTAWNGLVISALARGSWLANKPEYLRVAQKTADWLLAHVWVANGSKGKRLYRTYHRNRTGSLAVLSDYAFLIQALLDLFEADGNTRWLTTARLLQEEQDIRFLNESWGGYFHIPEEAGLLVRRTHDYDGAEPSGNSVTAWNLLRLANFIPESNYENAMIRLFRAFGHRLRRAGAGIPYMADALSAYHGGLRQLVIVAPNKAPAAGRPLLETLHTEYVPDVIHVSVSEGNHQHDVAQQLEWVKGKPAIKGKATAYLCRNNTCKRPTSKPATLRKQLRQP
ncbi:MAG: thioredoxin domain-containing protein [Myxococcales bacterium]|nr:thioredoxin domain-containing protein [Myxococcales bacterium]